MPTRREHHTTRKRKEVQLRLGELPTLPLSRGTRKADGLHLSVVERVLLSERDGITIQALLGRTPDGWVAGWLALGPGKRLRQQPVASARNRPQAERDTALALALKGALDALSDQGGPLDWRRASLLKKIGLPQSKPKSTSSS